MTRRARVYMPRWTLRIILPLIVVIWLFVTYSAFATPSGRDELGIVGWLIVTVVVVLVGTMMWLMGTGKLPAYEIEFDDSDEPRR